MTDNLKDAEAALKNAEAAFAEAKRLAALKEVEAALKTAQAALRGAQSAVISNLDLGLLNPLEKAEDNIAIAKSIADRLEKALNIKKTPPAHAILLANAEARIEDAATYPADATEANFTWGDFVSHKDLMTALANPFAGPRNLRSIWDNNISKLSETLSEDNDNELLDEALMIAENRSTSGLATTTLMVTAADEPREIPVHIVLNTDDSKGLIVGEKVSPTLSASFRKAGITYVDRHAKNAPAKIQSALDELTRGSQYGTKMSLSDAFRYRNDVPPQDERPLSALLLDEKVEQMFPKYVVKKSKPAA